MKEEGRVIEEAMKEKDRIEAQNVEADDHGAGVENECRREEKQGTCPSRKAERGGMRRQFSGQLLDYDHLLNHRYWTGIGPTEQGYRRTCGLERLFPSDPEKRAAKTDLDGERFALYH